jgi:IclR family acetate operon transcriptional repressor
MMATPKNRSVMKAFSLLQSFRAPDEWLSSSELSRRAQLPEASGYRLMQTLEGIGAVVRDTRGRYRPGMLLLALSRGVHEQDLWSRVPQGLLDALARNFGCAIQIGTMDDSMVTYVAHAGRQSAGPRIMAGMQLEAYCTAIGKVLLAAFSDTALDAFLAEGELVRLTANTIVDRNTLKSHLAGIQLDGWATDFAEMVEDLACVAVPIRNAEGRVVAAVSASDSAVRMNEVRQQQLRQALIETAASISARLYPLADCLQPLPERPVHSNTKITACGTRW